MNVFFAPPPKRQTHALQMRIRLALTVAHGQ